MEMNIKRAFLDTSVIVRYLVGEPTEQATQASHIILETEGLQISDVALTETVYVLRTRYQVPRETIIDSSLIALIQRDNISVYAMDDDLALQGLTMCRPSGRVSISDAMIWVAARSNGARAIYTFDQRFPSEDLEIRQRV